MSGLIKKLLFGGIIVGGILLAEPAYGQEKKTIVLPNDVRMEVVDGRLSEQNIQTLFRWGNWYMDNKQYSNAQNLFSKMREYNGELLEEEATLGLAKSTSLRGLYNSGVKLFNEFLDKYGNSQATRDGTLENALLESVQASADDMGYNTTRSLLEILNRVPNSSDSYDIGLNAFDQMLDKDFSARLSGNTIGWIPFLDEKPVSERVEAYKRASRGMNASSQDLFEFEMVKLGDYLSYVLEQSGLMKQAEKYLGNELNSGDLESHFFDVNGTYNGIGIHITNRQDADDFKSVRRNTDRSVSVSYRPGMKVDFTNVNLKTMLNYLGIDPYSFKDKQAGR